MALAFNDPRGLHELLFGKQKQNETDIVKKLKRLGFAIKE